MFLLYLGNHTPTAYSCESGGLTGPRGPRKSATRALFRSRVYSGDPMDLDAGGQKHPETAGPVAPAVSVSGHRLGCYLLEDPTGR